MLSLFRRALEETEDRLESRIRQMLNQTPTDRPDEQDSENFYRLLGAYRSASQALVDYVSNAGDIEWAGWQEERFA